MMLRRIFGKLDLPIDTEIHWQTNAYNTDSDLEGPGLLASVMMFPSISMVLRLNNIYLSWNTPMLISFLDDLGKGLCVLFMSMRMTVFTLFESKVKTVFAKFSFVRLELNTSGIESLRELLGNYLLEGKKRRQGIEPWLCLKYRVRSPNHWAICSACQSITLAISPAASWARTYIAV
jgi:hypothetical protein